MSVEASFSEKVNEFRLRLMQRRDSIEASLRRDSCLMDAYSITRCAAAARVVDPYTYAGSISGPHKAFLGKLRNQYQAGHVDDWNRLTLLLVLQHRLASRQFLELPAGIRHWSLMWFEDMLDRACQRGGRFDFVNPDGSTHRDLCFDFAVAAGRMLPVGGAWVVERRRSHREDLFDASENEGRSVESQGAFWQRARQRVAKRLRRAIVWLASVAGVYGVCHRLLVLMREAKGEYGSYLWIHTANHYRRWFSERYQQVAFSNIAALLELDPELEGLYRTSWLLDPQIVAMDPRLGFLTEIPKANGARYERRCEFDVENRKEILAFSATRREQFASGSYSPQEWAYLWSRDGISKWKESL